MERTAQTIQLLKNYTALQASAENLTQQLRRQPQPATRQALEDTRHWLDRLGRSLDALTEEERTVLDMLYIHPKKGNATRLCQVLEVEQSTVYRRRDKALEHLNLALYGPRAVPGDNSFSAATII